MRFDRRIRSIGIVLVLCVGPPGHGAPYTFTLIADSSGLRGCGAPAINDLGTVAVRVANGDIFIGNDEPLTVVANSTFNGPPDINNAGTVAFGNDFQNGQGIFEITGGGHLITIADTSGPLAGGFYLGQTINNRGIVAFEAAYLPHSARTAILAGSGGPLTTIADSSWGFYLVYGSVINEREQVGFVAQRLNPTRETLYVGDGLGLTKIAEVATPLGFTTELSINNSGKMAARVFDYGNPANQRIITGRGGDVTTVVDTTGPFAAVFAPAIEESGDVVFGVVPRCGGWVLLASPDPVRGRIVGTGDSLFGSTVLGIGFDGSRGLNSNGQIALLMRLADGHEYIVRADPSDSNMPSTLVIDGCDTSVADQVFDTGCSMGGLVVLCAEKVSDHRAFVACVRELTVEWRHDGLITARERARIVRCAAQSELPKPQSERGIGPGGSPVSLEGNRG
jgi:hypothetical protein